MKSPQIDLLMPDQGKRWHRLTAQQVTHEFTGLNGDRGRKSQVPMQINKTSTLLLTAAMSSGGAAETCWACDGGHLVAAGLRYDFDAP